MNTLRLPVVALLILALLLQSCAPGLRRELRLPEQVGSVPHEKSTFLNAHLRDGDYIAFDRWTVDSTGQVVSGEGRRLDPDRRVVGEGHFDIPVSSVAMFEAASTRGMSPVMKAITIVLVGTVILLGVVLLAVAIACASNPKCFGSCPTFYTSDGDQQSLMAEGFSASVAPSLEATDVDALARARVTARRFEVTMKNEALETHVVRFVNVLAAPRAPGARVFATADGAFWEARDVRAPLRASGAEGDCRAALLGLDGTERTSPVDSTDLAARETVDLEFAAGPDERVGLVVGSRQTLLTTYLFYQTLAYMGGSAGRWLARLERGDRIALDRSRSLGRELGGIEVQVQDGADGWKTVGTLNETGPLATDVKLVPLPALGTGPARVRLRAARGHIRLDWVALARLEHPVTPERLEPVAAWRGGVEDPDVVAALRDSARFVVTEPGDEVRLAYDLPGDGSGYELFLESRGYYLEWMRQRWIDEENPERLAALMLNPRQALRDLAPAYAREQAELEEWFWSSRFAKP